MSDNLSDFPKLWFLSKNRVKTDLKVIYQLIVIVNKTALTNNSFMKFISLYLPHNNKQEYVSLVSTRLFFMPKL
jgi:hypothetical protein